MISAGGQEPPASHSNRYAFPAVTGPRDPSIRTLEGLTDWQTWTMAIVIGLSGLAYENMCSGLKIQNTMALFVSCCKILV